MRPAWCRGFELCAGIHWRGLPGAGRADTAARGTFGVSDRTRGPMLGRNRAGMTRSMIALPAGVLSILPLFAWRPLRERRLVAEHFELLARQAFEVADVSAFFVIDKRNRRSSRSRPA